MGQCLWSQVDPMVHTTHVVLGRLNLSFNMAALASSGLITSPCNFTWFNRLNPLASLVEDISATQKTSILCLMNLALAIRPSLERSSKELPWAKVESPRTMCAVVAGWSEGFEVGAPLTIGAGGAATAGAASITGLAPPEPLEVKDGKLVADPDWVE